MYLSNPPLTAEEEHELADIDEDAHDAFYRTIRFRWYADAVMYGFWAFAAERLAATLFGHSLVYTVLAILLGLTAWYVRRRKWDRQTDYGALARAKLAEDAKPDWVD